MGAYADAYTSTLYRRTQNPRIAKSFWQITGSVKDPQKNIYRNPKLCLEIDAALLSFHNFSIKSLWGVGFECVSRGTGSFSAPTVTYSMNGSAHETQSLYTKSKKNLKKQHHLLPKNHFMIFIAKY